MMRMYFQGYKVLIRENEDPPRPKWGCTLTVDEHGYVEFDDWFWNGEKRKPGGYRFSNPEDVKRYEACHEMQEYLAEVEELIELKPIGPEDSEYFATEKLWEVIKRR